MLSANCCGCVDYIHVIVISRSSDIIFQALGWLTDSRNGPSLTCTSCICSFGVYVTTFPFLVTDHERTINTAGAKSCETVFRKVWPVSGKSIDLIRSSTEKRCFTPSRQMKNICFTACWFQSLFRWWSSYLHRVNPQLLTMKRSEASRWSEEAHVQIL